MLGYLYMLVKSDEYELLLMVCETARELAEKSGSSVNNIMSSISKLEHGKLKTSKFRRVRNED